jgi:hypothetical protein
MKITLRYGAIQQHIIFTTRKLYCTYLSQASGRGLLFSYICHPNSEVVEVKLRRGYDISRIATRNGII